MTHSIVLAAEGFNPLKPDPGLFVWVTIAFLVVLFVLAKKVFPKLQESLADREAKIGGDIAEAERIKQEAEAVLADYKARVAQAREEANKILEETRQSADSVRKDLIAKSEGEARLIVDKAQKELAGERERTIKAIQSQLAEWSTRIASRIVERELTPDGQSHLVEAFIADLEKESQGS